MNDRNTSSCYQQVFEVSLFAWVAAAFAGEELPDLPIGLGSLLTSLDTMVLMWLDSRWEHETLVQMALAVLTFLAYRLIHGRSVIYHLPFSWLQLTLAHSTFLSLGIVCFYFGMFSISYYTWLLLGKSRQFAGIFGNEQEKLTLVGN